MRRDLGRINCFTSTQTEIVDSKYAAFNQKQEVISDTAMSAGLTHAGQEEITCFTCKLREVGRQMRLCDLLL